jgi:hypothetical protein
MRYYLFLLFSGVIFSSCGKGYLPGYDYNLFNGTKAEKLAGAVENTDLALMEHLVLQDPELVNYQEPQFGHTLLMLAIANNNDIAANKLLNLGASVQIRANTDSADVVMILCRGFQSDKCDTAMLRQLISRGGSMDTYAFSRPGIKVGPINEAIGSNMCLEFIEVLIELGANPNLKLNSAQNDSPLVEAILLKRWDVVDFLITLPGFELPEYCIIRKNVSSSDTVTASELITEIQSRDQISQDTVLISKVLKKVFELEDSGSKK